jgi:hypothetical protein
MITSVIDHLLDLHQPDLRDVDRVLGDALGLADEEPTMISCAVKTRSS